MSTVKPPLTLPLIMPLTISPSSKAFSRDSRLGALGFFARQPGVAKTVFHGIQRHFDLIADRHLEFAQIVEELFNGDDRPRT